MPNNPVQIILNAQDFHQAPDPGQAPRNKDFFEDADREFVEHKDLLLAAVDRVINEIRRSNNGPAAYLMVQMRNEALAKSYRPVSWLFKPDQFPCVGADGVGTLYFRAPLIHLEGLRRRIGEAEARVQIKIRRIDGQPYKAPSAARAEVGAIESLEIAPPERKRTFSTSAAISALVDPRVVSGYQVELFEAPYERVISDDALGISALRRSLEKLLLSLGMGARSYLEFEIGRTPVLEVQLTAERAPARIEDRRRISGGGLRSAERLLPTDLNPERHEAALSALQSHPLVRSILPPVLLQLANDHADQEAEVNESEIVIPRPSDDSSYPIVGVIDSGISPVLEGWTVGQFDYLSSGEFDMQHGTHVAGILAAGQLINGNIIAPEADGCYLYDIPLFPVGNFSQKYPRGFSEFLEEIEQAVAEAKSAHNVRVCPSSDNLRQLGA